MQQVDIRKFVTDRLTQMHKTPMMWASSKEAFACQVSLLLELIDPTFDSRQFHEDLFRVPGLSYAVGLTDAVTDTWARWVVEQVMHAL